MPFEIKKRGDEYVVVTKGTKRVHGRFKSKAKALAQMKALYANVPEARTAKHAADPAVSTVDKNRVVFDLGTGVAEGDHVLYRDSKLFEAGDYPDKGFAMTPAELAEVVAAFTPVPVGLEHIPNVLDGTLGDVRGVRLSDCGTELRGTVAIPADIDRRLGPGRRKVSCEFDRATKRLAKLDLVLAPRVRDACLMAAFGRPAGRTPHGQSRMQMLHDMAAEGGAMCDPGKSKFTSGKERSGLQSIHDLAVAHGAACRIMSGGRAAYSNGGGRMSFKEKFTAWFQKNVPDDFDPAADDDSTVVLSAKTPPKPVPDPEKEELKRQVAALTARQAQVDAAAFADDLIRSGKATPAERADLVVAFAQAARDDADYPARVTFADAAGKPAEGSRVEALKALYARRPAARFTEELLPSHVTLSNDQQDSERERLDKESAGWIKRNIHANGASS